MTDAQSEDELAQRATMTVDCKVRRAKHAIKQVNLGLTISTSMLMNFNGAGMWFAYGPSVFRPRGWYSMFRNKDPPRVR
jgi:hypothetical protein